MFEQWKSGDLWKGARTAVRMDIADAWGAARVQKVARRRAGGSILHGSILGGSILGGSILGRSILGDSSAHADGERRGAGLGRRAASERASARRVFRPPSDRP